MIFAFSHCSFFSLLASFISILNGFRAGIGEAELLPNGKILVHLVPKYSETAKKRMS